MNTDSDHGPGYLPEERGQGELEVLSIGLKPLLGFVESQIDMLPPGARVATFRLRGGPAVQIDIDLAERLIDGWTATGERSLSSNVHIAKGSLYAADAGVRVAQQKLANMALFKLDSLVAIWPGNGPVIGAPNTLFPAGAMNSNPLR